MAHAVKTFHFTQENHAFFNFPINLCMISLEDSMFYMMAQTLVNHATNIFFSNPIQSKPQIKLLILKMPQVHVRFIFAFKIKD